MSNHSLSSAIPDPKRWWALVLLCAAQFIVILDTSIIGVALPAIQQALDYSQSGLQWVFNAYVIFFGGFLLLGGRLSDLFGARKLFMMGFVILTLSSLLAGVAQSEEVLNISRAIQGFGSALIAPSAMTMLTTLFMHSPKELNKAFGFWGASAAAGGSAGVFFGGVITQWLDWRWVFYVYVPIGLIVLVFSMKLLRAGVVHKGKVDLLGSLLVTASIVLSVYAIVQAEQAGWGTAQTVWRLIGAAVLLIAFLIVQKMKKEPLVPLGILKRHNLAFGNIVTAMLAGSWIPLWFFLNLYLQQVLNYSAISSGLALLPMTGAIMLLMVGVTGKLMARFGFKPNLVVGLAALGGSLLMFAQTPVDGSFVANILPASLLAAVGMALSYIPSTVSSISGAQPEEAGLASGIVNTSYQVGSALGLAAMVAISGAQTKSLLSNGTDNILALNGGFHSAFLTAGIVAFAASVIALIALRQQSKS
ncbi:MFS transporter [Cohnella silvisoli]|uniref:MFS transporter n=1 Tax=Cohnella silvisoli TaxID=2873699 RepID=A0ABV1KQN6_9BACL|nr:MFS transporter [Cohnella silvisoli]MCD9020910.1 MFS transporter [Cohnella silvisoli]